MGQIFASTFGTMTVIAVYVDDLILITATDAEGEGKLNNSI